MSLGCSGINCCCGSVKCRPFGTTATNERVLCESAAPPFFVLPHAATTAHSSQFQHEAEPHNRLQVPPNNKSSTQTPTSDARARHGPRSPPERCARRLPQEEQPNRSLVGSSARTIMMQPTSTTMFSLLFSTEINFLDETTTNDSRQRAARTTARRQQHRRFQDTYLPVDSLDG